MIGTRLSAYEILSDLGSGGMGSVYLAECVDAAAGLDLQTKVALKVIHPNLLSQPGFFKRFLREAQIGQEVQHENVVRTYDCDATDVDGAAAHFLVMEYVEGQTLRDLLKELERVPEELCRHIGREVARGLAAIHEAGVVHRDIKPENVLITEEHVVKVMDLGVARLQDEAIRLSQAGTFVGSLEYAAPEQFRSVDGEPDGRADLHSLGVLLYELSTGQHPYGDEDASKVLRNILEETPRKVGEVNPQLSPFFEEVVQTLIAKDREERFPDAADLAMVLEEGEKSDWWKERAKALRIETKRPLRRIRIPRETSLYGRDGDLAKLHGLFDKAKAGDGRVLLIEGEAGIGKTRLVDEFVGRLRQSGEDINFLFGSYPPGGAATASGAFSEAYREQFGAEGLEDTLADYLKPTPVLIFAFAAVLKGETTPTGAEPLTKDSLQTVFVHATRGLAAERTTVVLIDDLHFAPEDGRALFTSLAMACPGHRILLLGTMRPGVREDWIANVERLEQAGRAVLSRLGPKDLVALLKDAFRSERLARELALQISEKSDGNPFFAFEIIRGLREGQFISQQPDGTWATTKVIEDIQVPSSVLDLVNARVADLTDDERNFLDVASCLDFEFDSRVVAEVLGLDRIPALQMLAKIEKRHRLVRSAGDGFVFDHHQVQEALHGALSKPLREEYHAAIAEALEVREKVADQDPEDLDGALCVDLCEHFLQGNQGERALRYLDAALTHLERGFLNDQVIALADRALDVPNLLQGERRLAALLRKNERLDLLGRRKAQWEVLAQARALAVEWADAASLAKVESAAGVLLDRTGRSEEAKAHFERHLAIAREIGDREGEAFAAGALGAVFHGLGRYDEAKAKLRQHLAIAREIGDRQAEATATGNLGSVFYRLGRYEEAEAHFERQLALAREIGDRRREANATGSLGAVFSSLGRHGVARAHFERQFALVREIGYRLGEAAATGNLGSLLNSIGHYEEAKSHFERQLVITREIGYRQGEAIALVNLGPMWLDLGETGRARQVLERSLALCREMGARHPEGYALWGLSAVAQQEDDSVGALDLARKALALRRDIDHGDGVADSLAQLGDIHWRAGDRDAAREALQGAMELLRQQQRKGELAQALALSACLHEDSIEGAQAALDNAGESGNTPRVRYMLWKATGDRRHLQEAMRLLGHLVEHAPEEYRESMLDKVRLNREIMEAWAERGQESAS